MAKKDKADKPEKTGRLRQLGAAYRLTRQNDRFIGLILLAVFLVVGGVVFAVGWTPCVGPTLAAVGFLAADGGDLPRAVLLGLAYCLGLGLPFLLVALGFGWVGGGIAWVKRHIRAVNIAGGVLLIVIGVLMLSGAWTWLMSALGAVISDFAISL